MRTILLLVFALLFLSQSTDAQSADEKGIFVSTERGKDKLTISASKQSTPLLISSKDWEGVQRAFDDLRSDIGKVASAEPRLYLDTVPESKELIVAGTIGKSPLIDSLVREKKIEVTEVAGKWETFLVQVVNKPFPGVKRALVIAGSDKRGTIYGIYECSKQMGVSPWYWWADVPVPKKAELYVNAGRYAQGSPSVKYRGIFLNDEAPDLTNWIREKFGTVPVGENPPIPGRVANYGHEFYTKLFELILRLKGNYLWPAMWNNAFNEDDPENPRLADEYGIVMGNSHQEPMLRAIKLLEVAVADTPAMGVSVEGSEAVWPGEQATPVLPGFDVFNKQKHYIDIFNKGKSPFDFDAEPSKPWLRLGKAKTPFGKDNRLWVEVDWSKIEGYGHTLSAMRAASNVDAAPGLPGKNAPCLEYQMYLFTTGTFDVTGIFSPTLNFMPGRGLQYAISFDEEAPEVITLVPENFNAMNRNAEWEKSVSDNARFSHSTHQIKMPGYHTLKIFMVDPGVVLQKIIVNTGGLKQSYLGPPESFYKPFGDLK